MALPPIGSEEVRLLYIESKDFTLTVKGRPVPPVAKGLGVVPEDWSEHYVATLNIEGAYDRAVCFDPAADEQLAPYIRLQPVFACFYEQTPYEIVIEREGDQEVSFYHRNQHLRSAVRPVGRRQTLTGMLNFRSDIGLTSFEVKVAGRTALTITLEVFPAKLRYREDYWQMLHEVNREVYNLAFDFLRRTYLKAKLNSHRQASLSEFYSVISFIFDRLLAAFERVKLSPHQKIVQDHAMVRPEQVRRTDHISRRWVERHPPELCTHSHGIAVNGCTYLPRRMLDARKRISHDTYENRVLKWMLVRVQDKLGELKRRYLHSGQADAEVVNSIERMQRSTRAMLATDFLRDCGQLARVDGQSLVLLMAPGYREIYRYYLMLTKGLSIQGEIFELSVKDVAQLYEYWCFLTLGSILRQRYRLERQNAIVVRGEGLAVMLDTTHRADLEFLNEQNGERYVLSYNTRQPQSPTVAQRPDNILTLQKAGSDVDYRFVFDAKYRIDPALAGTPYHISYHKPGPQEEDINTMHRYRDALVYRQPAGDYRRGTFGAIILFPYADEDKYTGLVDGRPHRFFQSIEQVGVGGLPFLPGHTGLVERLLDDLILASPETAHEQGGETEGTEQYYEERFAQRNVMVGVVGGRDHFEYHLRTRTYHIPSDQLPKGCSHIEHIALYEPSGVNGDGFRGVRYCGRVLDARLTERSEIDVPSRRKGPGGQYVLFQVNDWGKVGPIVPAGYGVRRRIYTTPYLLKRARQLPELSLKSEEEIRLWKELQRLSDAVQVSLASKQVDEETRAEGFEVGGKRVAVRCDAVLVDGVRIGSVGELRARPMRLLRRLEVHSNPVDHRGPVNRWVLRNM